MKKESLTFFTIILMVGASVFVSDAPVREQNQFSDLSIKDFPVPLPRYETNISETEETEYIPEFLNLMEESEVTVIVMRKESLGWYFITAYCPSECGYNGSNYPTGWYEVFSVEYEEVTVKIGDN